MKAYKLKFNDGSYEVVFAKDAIEVIRKYDLASKKHINTRIIELQGEQKAIAFSNIKGSNMNGYKAFYKGKQLEVYANTGLEAQTKASELFKAKKRYEVTVVLCEKNGEQVVHIADF